MGKKGSGKRNRTEADLSDPVMNSTNNSDGSVLTDCQRTNAENIIKILEMVQSINTNIEALQHNFLELKSDISAVTNRVTTIENKNNMLENELVSVKSELRILKNIVEGQTDIINKCKEEINSVVSQSFVEENRSNECNVLFWGLNEVPFEDAESLIKKVMVHGLSLNSENLPSFSVIQCSKKFVKIKVDNTQVRFSLPKNAKKLKGKKFSTQNNVFICDDVTPRVSIVRKELLAIRKCLVDNGVEYWVPPTLPPVICVKKDNTVAKVLWYNAKDLLIP